MGKPAQDSLPLALAKGERIIQRCDYLDQGAGKGSRHASIFLTNKRLIHGVSLDGGRSNRYTYNEVPVEHIDSLDYCVGTRKTPVMKGFLIAGIILLVLGIADFISSRFFLGALFENLPMEPDFSKSLLQYLEYGSYGDIGLGIVFILLAFLTRKKYSMFYLRAFSHKQCFAHLAVGKKKQEIFEGKKPSKAANFLINLFRVLIILGCLGGIGYEVYLIVMAMIASFQSGAGPGTDWLPNAYIAGGILAGMIILLIVLAIIGHHVNKAPKEKKQQPEVEDNCVVVSHIDTKNIQQFLDSAGALIMDSKRQAR